MNYFFLSFTLKMNFSLLIQVLLNGRLELSPSSVLNKQNIKRLSGVIAPYTINIFSKPASTFSLSFFAIIFSNPKISYWTYGVTATNKFTNSHLAILPTVGGTYIKSFTPTAYREPYNINAS